MPGLIHKTIGQLLDEVAGKYPENDAVVFPNRKLRYSYEDFNRHCQQVAKGFMKLGLEKGDHLAVWTSNQPEWLSAQFATGKMGAVLVTVNTNFQTAELEYLLSHSDSTTLILMESYKGTSYVDMLYEIVPELKTSEPGKLQSKSLPFLKNVVILGEKRFPGMFLWSDIMRLGLEIDDQTFARRQAELQPDDVINMQYTSGTTGYPKGVMLSHYNLINNANSIATCMKLTEKDRLCIPVPFFHTFGCVLGTLTSVTAGTTMVIVEEFQAEQVLEAIEAEKCTALHGVPTMFIAELNHPDFEKYDLTSLRTGIMAGSTCPIEVMKAVTEKMGAKEITIAYGQTESSPVITQTRTNDPLEIRVATVGRALPNVEVKIVEPGTNREVPSDVEGELCTRGYHVMRGYYKNEKGTREAIDDEGWLHTGDLAVLDKYGYCRIVGRLKDLIIRGGENIYPREIEEYFYQHPKVLDVQVVGVPDEFFGEEAMAWVILKENETASEVEIKEYFKRKISRQKIPRYIQFCEGFPLTASGKIQKFKLRQMGLELINARVLKGES
ncbi:putative acyl-CoA synthetase YngI [Siminovitchia terrae]|uniref:Acyl-CoA synthetase YngI n=1 Tax=Siminovitchia terrae TaxID=1914933 RepID=A0ABQ4L1Y4_SIMTE|nr:AMP-binding protein [Siminovitchia terrae]GIN98296.1 putative acyl-CoA synthetase YngI [Siminovitchia terrae]